VQGVVTARTQGERRYWGNEDGRAVGSGTRGRLRRYDGAGARTIVDNGRARELLLQLLRQHPGEYVGAAAGGKRTEKSDRALRVIAGGGLSARRLNGGEAGPQRQSEHESSFHAFGPCPGTALVKRP